MGKVQRLLVLQKMVAQLSVEISGIKSLYV